MTLSHFINKFILHFGEMGSRWGINRTAGQIYALLYLSKSPLNAHQLVKALGFSRSNIAIGLKELLNMNLVMLKHIKSDRKDYYITHDNIWDIIRNLVEARRKKEIAPTLTMLKFLIMELPSSEEDQYVQEKIQEMHDVIQMLTNWYNEMHNMQTEHLINLFKMGAKIYNLYMLKDKLNIIPTDWKTTKRRT